MPLDITPRAAATAACGSACRSAPCSFISPFNFPLNLAAHKVAPALAVGCPFVLKPASLHADRRADHRRGAGRDRSAARRLLDPAVPPRRRRPVHHRRAAQAAVASPARRRSAGTSRRAPARRRWCSSWAATPRWWSMRDADLDDAVRPHRLRRVLPVRPELHRRAAHHRPRATSTTSSATGSSPRRARCRWAIRRTSKTFIGPMISEKEAIRLARLDRGGARSGRDACSAAAGASGAMLEATLLENARRDARSVRRGGVRSGRGPVAVPRLRRPRSARSTTARSGSRPASSRATSTRRSDAWDALEVGRRRDRRRARRARVDHMPYGGVKDQRPRPRGRPLRDGGHVRDPLVGDPRTP